MKNIVFLFTILLVNLFFSCDSEYDHQVQLGKQLIEQERLLMSNRMDLNFNYSIEHELIDLNEKLLKCAEISGNKELYMQEMNAFRASVHPTQLITKYP